MTPEITPQKRAAAIIKKWLTPTLQARGFTKKGIVYTRVLADVVHLVDIQQSDSNKKTAVSFALNIGVYVPGVHVAIHPGYKPKKLDAASGLYHGRPGFLCVPISTTWWDVKSSEDPAKDDDIGRNMLAVVEEGAFRYFFDRFMNKKSLAEFLASPREKRDVQTFPFVASVRFVYAGLIWDQLGDYDRCRECMAKAVEAAKGKRLEADMEKFAREYVCGSVNWNHFPMPRG
jgi:Domain of unknown function (DUF4304)